MSGNQKQAPSGAPQQQRYQHGADGFHVTTPPTGFVPQQTSNQPSNQGPAIRGMAQSGPPNQSSTPPQNDLKQMQQQQQPQISMAYVQQQVRASHQGGYYRPPPQNQGGPRINNHHRQSMATTAATAAPMYSQHMPIYQSTMGQAMAPYPVPIQYPNNPRPQFFSTQPYSMIPGQYLHGTYPTQQPQAQQFYYPSTTPIMQGRQGPPPPVASAPQAGAQPAQQAMTMQPPMPQHPKKKQRAKAIPIINPNSGKEIFDEEESQPPSGESSARETPQPSQAASMQQLISADFAARVAIVASEDKDPVEPELPVVHPVTVQPPISFGPPVLAQQQQQQQLQHHMVPGSVAPPKENDLHKVLDNSVVQNSKLQASTKEFVPEITKHTSKENNTPVVSANTDGAEVMLPNKQSRERESPAKTRRQQQQQQQQQQHQQQPQHHQQQPQHHQQQQQHQQRDSVPKETVVVEATPVAPIKEPVAVAPAVVHHEPEVKGNKVQAAIPKVKSNVEPKVPATIEHRPPVVPQTNATAPVDDAPVPIASVKSKGGSQKAKENQASAPVQQSKSNMPVPGSQPPKPSSKANKMRELNMKGASKEGTDMDAFNTAEASAVENCNNEPVLKEEIVEPPVTQPPPQQPQQQPQQQQQPQPAQQVPQKLADVKTMPKHKVDVTSIVKDVPKPLKPQVQQQAQQQQPTTESQDETDRAACEKFVQVKNEANSIKTNSSDNNSDTQVIDKTVIRYKKDQWSPMNKDGKKCYDRDFLFSLQNNPKCKKKPENLPDLEIVLKDHAKWNTGDPRYYSLNYRQTEVLMPSFHKSLSQRGPLPKRNSQQGKPGSKGGKPNTIHVSLSLREDVKLRETENAWRPARLNSSAVQTDDDAKTADLYKKVRGVLNKLTPEKFERLLNQVRALSIDNEERLQGVIDLVFEKAVDEPNFSVAYANMCKELAMMQVPSNSKNKEEPEFVNFRKLLITRCQIEFEKNSVDENARNLKLKEIDECTDPEKKKELQMQLEEDDRRLRVKSVGNIRFIGELFKQQMLTVNIMLRCINILLKSKDEDSLECLCKLLTTIGKDLELNKKQNLEAFFVLMQEIVDKKHGRISSRVRFMLQDVIDLRNSKWVPRRQDLNPRTMEQIQKEADTEQLNIQVMNSGPMSTPRKDDRMGGGGGGGGGSGPGAGSDRKRRNNQTDDGGWSMATSRNRAQYTVESSKLMNKPPPIDDMTLGSKNLFGQWGRGSNIKTQAPVTNTTNMYAALENISAEQEKNRSNYDNRMGKDSYVSKGLSMERGYKHYEDGRGSRSGSQHRNAPSNQQQQQQQQQQKPAPVVAAPVSQPAAPPKQQLNSDQLRLRMQNIMEEYLNDCCTLAECETDIRASIDASKLNEFVVEGYNSVLERSASTRRKAGKLFAHLVNTQVLGNEELTKALREVLSQADDLIIDIPKLWDYLAEMILPLVTDGVVPLNRLRVCADVLITQGHAHKLLAQLLKQLVADNGPNYAVDLWQSSGVRFTDFMAADSVDSYIKDHKLDFLMGGAGTPVGQDSLSWDQVYNKLSQFFNSNTPFDTITDWISANVGERVNENQFIRIMVTAIIEDAVNDTKKLRREKLVGHYTLLQRYIDNKEQLELQCLFALQALVHKWEHPSGLLLSILERFWEDNLLSTDSFLAWEKCNDPAEQEGKGVALKSLQSLFTALKEVDDDTASTTSEDA